jgi:GNAT superfamily N-acetyltransferase
MNAIEYRKPKAADLDGIFKLWWEMQSEHVAYDPVWYGLRSKRECRPLCLKWLRKNLSHQNAVIFIAIADGHPIGMVLGFLTNRPPVHRQIKVLAIENAVVAKPWRRRGVLRQLMKLITAEGATRGATIIKLTVHAANLARKAYEKLGFTCHELSMGKYVRLRVSNRHAK